MFHVNLLALDGCFTGINDGGPTLPLFFNDFLAALLQIFGPVLDLSLIHIWIWQVAAKGGATIIPRKPKASARAIRITTVRIGL